MSNTMSDKQKSIIEAFLTRTVTGWHECGKVEKVMITFAVVNAVLLAINGKWVSASVWTVLAGVGVYASPGDIEKLRINLRAAN